MKRTSIKFKFLSQNSSFKHYKKVRRGRRRKWTCWEVEKVERGREREEMGHVAGEGHCT